MAVVLNEYSLANEAIERLQQHTGLPMAYRNREKAIAGNVVDGELTIGDAISFWVEVKKNLRSNQVYPLLQQIQSMAQRAKEAGSDHPWMLITRYLSPPQQQLFRDHQLYYLDLAGNAFLEYEGSFVLIEGKSPKQLPHVSLTEPFTPAMLKMVFAYLLKPEILAQPYREQEKRTGVGIATISERLPQLEEAGYISRSENGPWKWRDRKALASKWIEAYSDILRPKLEMGAYKFSDLERYHHWQTEWPGKVALQWAGEPAGALLTDFLQPGRWTLYTRWSKVEVMKQLRLVPHPEGPIRLYRSFWPQALTADFPQQYVPPLLVYADLLATKDSRNRQIANMIKDAHLADLF